MSFKVSVIVPVWNQEELVIRALDSIPRRDDIEVVVVDDASTDRTYDNVAAYAEAHPELSIRIFRNAENRGLGYTKNVGYDNALGEYVHQLDSDDYLYTEEYSRAIDMIDGEDCIFFNLQINNGFTFELSPDSRMSFCAPTTKFVRRAFAEGIRYPEHEKNAGDWYYALELFARNPVCKYTGLTAYHYNHPREGSIYDLLSKGEL